MLNSEMIRITIHDTGCGSCTELHLAGDERGRTVGGNAKLFAGCSVTIQPNSDIQLDALNQMPYG